MNDNVNHPSHYTSHPSGIECIEITRHYCFSIGNAIKYLWRAGLKQDSDKTSTEKEVEDLKKALWYIRDRIHQINPFKFLYPKNDHLYTVLLDVRMKDTTTGEWKDAVLYTDGKGNYVREKEDFYNKFIKD